MDGKNVIAIGYATDNINPLVREISQLMSQMVSTEEDEEATSERKQMHNHNLGHGGTKVNPGKIDTNHPLMHR